MKVLPASTKLLLCLAIGTGAAGWALLWFPWQNALLAGWDVAALAFILVTWRLVLRLDAAQVKKYALREDPSRLTSEAVLLTASVISLLAVALVLAQAHQSASAQIGPTILSVVSVIVSWLIVQTVYALRYAKMYYATPSGGIDFGPTGDPIYVDFAYLAFTMAMTYQVSDTSFKTRAFRRAALTHALLSYGFGTVIIATTINLVGGLGK